MTRRTIYCKDLDQVFDIVQAWQEGRFAAVRDFIKNERKQPMQEKEYDNSNRVALWHREDKAKGVYQGGGPQSGFNGVQISTAVLITRERRNGDNSPVADFMWVTNNGEVYHCPIFNNDGKNGGRVEGWWVNLYKNEKGPPITVKFNQMEAQAVPSGAQSDNAIENGDIPF